MNAVEILSVNLSEKKGTIKSPVEKIKLNHQGVLNDAHAGPWNRQVSMLGIESIERFEHISGRKITPGEFAENITTRGIELWKTHPLDRFISQDIELEITQIGKECHGNSCAIFREVGSCIMPKEGIFCRVISPGALKAGMKLEYYPRMFRIIQITLSDRASAGIYNDQSGALIKERVQKWFSEQKLNCFIHDFLIPDDPHKLETLLEKAKEELIDVVITSGGTGIGPRDQTPDIVKHILDKEIPGIMEAIRMKYGLLKPAALCSRSIAGVMGKTLVFTLPGSVTAVNEYLDEIFGSLLHLIYMLNGLDLH